MSFVWEIGGWGCFQAVNKYVYLHVFGGSFTIYVLKVLGPSCHVKRHRSDWSFLALSLDMGLFYHFFPVNNLNLMLASKAQRAFYQKDRIFGLEYFLYNKEWIEKSILRLSLPTTSQHQWYTLIISHQKGHVV